MKIGTWHHAGSKSVLPEPNSTLTSIRLAMASANALKCASIQCVIWARLPPPMERLTSLGCRLRRGSLSRLYSAEKPVPMLALRRSHVSRSFSLSRSCRQSRNRSQFVASRLPRRMTLLRNLRFAMPSEFRRYCAAVRPRDWTRGEEVIVWEILRVRYGVRTRRSSNVWRVRSKARH